MQAGWSVVVGALIGGGIAVVAQVISHRLARKRDTSATMRVLAAQLLAQGRVIQNLVAKTVKTKEIDHARLLDAVLPFVAAQYQLRWLVPDDVRPAVARFVEATNRMIARWDDRTDRLLGLEQETVDAANDLERAMSRALGRPMSS